jgi:hypothetical protein
VDENEKRMLIKYCAFKKFLGIKMISSNK